MTNQPPPAGPGRPDGRGGSFVTRYPKTAGFLGFLVAVFGGALISGLLAGLANATGSDGATRGAASLGGLVTLALFVLIPIWGYRRAQGRFLTGFFLGLGVLLVLIGTCVALIVASLSGA